VGLANLAAAEAQADLEQALEHQEETLLQKPHLLFYLIHFIQSLLAQAVQMLLPLLQVELLELTHQYQELE
jgi:hypothetical protein